MLKLKEKVRCTYEAIVERHGCCLLVKFYMYGLFEDFEVFGEGIGLSKMRTEF